MPADKCQMFPQIDTIILGVWPGMTKLPKMTSLLFLCNILRKKWVMKLIFCMRTSMKASNFPKFPKSQVYNVFTISPEEVRNEVHFLHVDKHQSFLQVDLNTLGISDAYMVILTIITAEHDQAFPKNLK